MMATRRSGDVKASKVKPHDYVTIKGASREVSIPPGRVTVEGQELVQLWFVHIDGLPDRHRFRPDDVVRVSREVP